MTAVAKEMLELADEIEKSDGLYCMQMKIGGHQLGIKRTALVIMVLREAAARLNTPMTERKI